MQDRSQFGGGQSEMDTEEHVSLAEIVEVRDAGFNTAELLAILYASCEHLLSRSDRKGLFSPALIFINTHGRIHVSFGSN